MAYKFDPVINTYVDPKSVEISKTLNERYAQNFGTADALSTAMRDMQYVSTFENDSKMARDLQKNTAANLEQMAARGDYENFTFTLTQAAKQFKDQYAPLEKNYQLVSKYQTEIEDLYKTGKIDANTMDKAFKYSANNYKGVKIDPNTGYADPTSYFRGVDVVQDPNILELVTKGIADMMADGDSSKVKRTGQGKDAQYEVLTENGWEGVSADRVKTITSTVLNQPNVQAFLEQDGRFETFDKSPEQLQSWAGGLIQQYQNNIAEIQKGNYKESEKTTAINNLNTEIQTLQQGMQNPEVLRQYAKQTHIQSRMQEFEDYAVAKKAYSKTTSSNVQDWDAKYLKDYENYLKNLPEVVVAGEAHEVPNIGGNSVNSIKATIDGYAGMMNALNDKINSGVYSIDQVDNMEAQVRDYQTKINQEQTRLNNALRASGADIQRVNQNLNVAKESATAYLQTMSGKGNITIGRVVDAADKNDAFLFPWEGEEDITISAKEAMQYFINNNFDIDRTLNAIKTDIQNKNPTKSIRFDEKGLEGLPEVKNLLKYYENSNPGLQAVKEDLEKANTLLKTTQKPVTTFTNVMPGFNASQRAINTKAINDFFKGGIPNHLHAFTSGGGLDQGVTSMGSLITDGVIGSDYKVVGQVLINEQSSNVGGGIGEDLYAVTVEYTGADSKPTKKTLYIPANEANTASGSTVLNHATNRWNRIVAGAKGTVIDNNSGEYVHTGVDTQTNMPIEYHINSIDNTVRVKHNGYWVSNENGPIKYGVGDPEFIRNFVDKSRIKF
jgi:hypothetical protein